MRGVCVVDEGLCQLAERAEGERDAQVQCAALASERDQVVAVAELQSQQLASEAEMHRSAAHRSAAKCDEIEGE